MKLIVAGSTGFLATEIIRQALAHPGVTSVLALARRETPIPKNLKLKADSKKLKSVVCQDFGNYSEEVKRQLAGADACIWTIAVLPTKYKSLPWDEVRKICIDYTLTGLDTITQLSRSAEAGNRPLHFVYVSGTAAERDPTKKPWLLGDYAVMRGEVENRILEYVKDSSHKVEACIAKPGLIMSAEKRGVVGTTFANVARSLISLPAVEVVDIAATLLEQATTPASIEKDTLTNDDLIRIGQQVQQSGSTPM